MSVNSLFNLDPTKYSLGKNSSTFRRVSEIPRQLSLSELLTGLQTPTVPSNIPTITPLTDEQKAQVDRWPTDFTGFASAYANVKIPGVSQTVDGAKKVLSSGGTSYAYAAKAMKDDWAAKNQIWSQYLITEQYKAAKAANESITSAYNNQVKAYNTVLDPYRAEVDTYNKAKDERVKNYNVTAVNPDLVTKETSQTTGDRLAESDLYSENLHNMMIDRISAQPVIDQVSSMFAKGT